jgi:hypothetical protein
MKKLELNQMESLDGGTVEEAAGLLAMTTLCSVVGLVASVGTTPVGGAIVGISCGFIFGGGLKALWDQ